MRTPAVAGQFYPAAASTLASAVDAMLDAVPGSRARGVAYVVPHAGYTYSGPTAAHAYGRLRAASDWDRVVLLGPAHFVGLDGCAVPAEDEWATPLGTVPIDTATARALADAGLATVDDKPHEPEHSLEVQLPFLQRCAPDFRLLPIAVGLSAWAAVARAIEAAVDGDPRTVVIASTDLSHYQREAAANAQDERTVQAVLDLAPDRIGVRDACGVYALRGLLGWARSSGRTPELLYRCTSAQAGGDRERVVGYAAVDLT
jgi:MEMO1 family protein